MGCKKIVLLYVHSLSMRFSMKFCQKRWLVETLSPNSGPKFWKKIFWCMCIRVKKRAQLHMQVDMV